MKLKLLVVVVVLALVGVVALRLSQPDLDASVERSTALHAEVVDIVIKTFGAPSDAQRYWDPARCGGLGGPTGKEPLVLVAEWPQTGFEEDRVGAVLDEAEAFLASAADVLETERSTGATGRLRLTARGQLFDISVVGPIAPDAARFVVSVATFSVCGDPSVLEDR